MLGGTVATSNWRPRQASRFESHFVPKGFRLAPEGWHARGEGRRDFAMSAEACIATFRQQSRVKRPYRRDLRTANFDPLSRRYFLCFRATHFVDKRSGDRWWVIASPDHVSVRPDQNQTALIEFHHVGLRRSGDFQRHAPRSSC